MANICPLIVLLLATLLNCVNAYEKAAGDVVDSKSGSPTAIQGQPSDPAQTETGPASSDATGTLIAGKPEAPQRVADPQLEGGATIMEGRTGGDTAALTQADDDEEDEDEDEEEEDDENSYGNYYDDLEGSGDDDLGKSVLLTKSILTSLDKKLTKHAQLSDEPLYSFVARGLIENGHKDGNYYFWTTTNSQNRFFPGPIRVDFLGCFTPDGTSEEALAAKCAVCLDGNMDKIQAAENKHVKIGCHRHSDGTLGCMFGKLEPQNLNADVLQKFNETHV